MAEGSGDTPDPVDTAPHRAHAAAHRPDPIGAPGDRDGSSPVAVALLGAGDAVRQRLAGIDGFTLVEVDAGDALPDVVLVSTRLPRTEAIALVTAHRESFAVVALVHTGGEALAADLLRAGARGLLAEGNEGTVRAFLTHGGQDTGLLEVYDRQIGRSQVLGSGQRGTDAVTGLPNGTVFDSRVQEAQLAGEVPRVGYARILFLQHSDLRASAAAVALIRRRLALQLLPIAAAHEVELFALSETDFAFVGQGLSPDRADQLGSALAAVAAAYAPWGHPLVVAVGHAGAEVSQDPGTVRQLAERAVEVAALEQRSTVVSAATLALGASSTTELEAALGLVAVVERHDPQGPGLSERTAALAGALAWELGYEGRSGAAIRLAAHLHDIGRIALPREAMFEGGDGDLASAARSHPVRGAEYLRPLAGAEVSAAVRAHHERWDGGGYPDGLAGDAIPVAARIIAVVADYVRMARDRGHDGAVAALVASAGAAYDPAIVDAAVPFLEAHLATATPTAR